MAGKGGKCVAGNTIITTFGTGPGMAADRANLRSGKAGNAKRAFAGLFAATAVLTGVAMTAKTIAKAAEASGRSRPCCSGRVKREHAGRTLSGSPSGEKIDFYPQRVPERDSMPAAGLS